MLKKAKEIIFKSKVKLNLYIHTCKEKNTCYFQLLYLMPNIFYKSVLVEEQVSLEVYFEAEKSFPCF